MFYLEDGREHFFQWDVNRRLVITDAAIDQVHFCNRTDDCSLVVETYEENGLLMADVPNILLQDKWDIKIYLYANGEYTKQCGTFKVIARTKPADYVYTETEALKWDTLEAEIKADVNETLAKMSNALIGTANGTGAVKIDDISPTAINIDVKTDVATGFKTYGKNLINYKYEDWEKIGSGYWYKLPRFNYDVMLSVERENDIGTVLVKRTTDNYATSDNYVSCASNKPFTPLILSDGDIYEYALYITQKTYEMEYVKRVQVEAGTVATEYEPYKEPVDGINIIYPTTTLVADTAGTAIEAKYNRDLNKAYEELYNAVLSLGANI